ncbi:Hypothetical protein NGAL_HAMBI1146_00460 [Neorhizobium galegae bv. officinalis]|nr:Hypothetical protein NGAL_HAMBI1146_00460 [Neorhizobium galegae bv. officinalis]
MTDLTSEQVDKFEMADGVRTERSLGTFRIFYVDVCDVALASAGAVSS